MPAPMRNLIKYLCILICIIFIVADVDECKTPGACNGICHNTEGSHYCTQCPSNTVYDTTIKMCASTKKQNLVLGEFYDTTKST
uniref:EGF-like calcium-binding domain-containing protein n=1 Tax=Aegilops tauschii subsp. strangulata TaxID=200361 RepID=A0A453MVE6_AEGTS